MKLKIGILIIVLISILSIRARGVEYVQTVSYTPLSMPISIEDVNVDMRHRSIELRPFTIPIVSPVVSVPSYDSGWVGHKVIDSYIDSVTNNENSRSWAKRVYRCESGGNAHAVNKSNGIYSGIFQWHPYYWGKQYPESIWDWKAQVRHSIEKYEAGGAGLWQCK